MRLCSWQIQDRAIQMWRVLVVEDDAQTREFFSGSVTRCTGLELASMQGRAEALGATLRLTSAPGRTVVEIMIE